MKQVTIGSYSFPLWSFQIKAKQNMLILKSAPLRTFYLPPNRLCSKTWLTDLTLTNWYIGSSMRYGCLFTSPGFLTVENSKYSDSFWSISKVLRVSNKVYSEYLSYSVRSVKPKLLCIRLKWSFRTSLLIYDMEEPSIYIYMDRQFSMAYVYPLNSLVVSFMWYFNVIK